MLFALRTFPAVALAAVATLIGGSAAGQHLAPATRDSLLRAAREAADRREHARAAELYHRLALDYSEDADLWTAYLQALLRAGRTDPSAAEKALELGPSFPRERIAAELAKASARAGRKEAAFGWLERALDWRLTPRTEIGRDSAFLAYHDDARFRELAGLLPNRPFTRDEGWRYDLAFLDREAKRLHASFERPAFSARFDAAVKDLAQRIPRLTDNQVVVEFQRLVVLLGDGHTKVNPHPSGKMLPIDVYFFSDGLFVVSGVGEGKPLVGSRILKFGSRSTEEILEELPSYVNRDNAMGIKWIGAWTLTALDFLQAMGGTDVPDRATLTIRDAGGATRAVTLQGGELRRIGPQKLPAPDSTSPDTPIYLRKVGIPYWFTSLPEASAIYFQFNQVRESPDEPIATFAAKLRAAVSEPAIKHLIVDVRHNSGGNSYLYPPFLRIIGAFQDGGADRRIFYLTGRNTFSAAQNFSTNVERLTNATFVGEPTGASPNFVGEGPILFDLPYSKTKATISNWYHQFSFWPDRRTWIAPDIPVELSSVDYFANRDPALQAILDILRPRAPSSIP